MLTLEVTYCMRSPSTFPNFLVMRTDSLFPSILSQLASTVLEASGVRGSSFLYFICPSWRCLLFKKGTFRRFRFPVPTRLIEACWPSSGDEEIKLEHKKLGKQEAIEWRFDQQPYLSIIARNDGSCRSCVAVSRFSGEYWNILHMIELISSRGSDRLTYHRVQFLLYVVVPRLSVTAEQRTCD